MRYLLLLPAFLFCFSAVLAQPGNSRPRIKFPPHPSDIPRPKFKKLPETEPKGIVAELGFSGGVAMFDEAKAGMVGKLDRGIVGLFVADFATDKNKHHLGFVFGSRIGLDPLGLVLGTVIGGQFNTAPGANVGFRTGLAAGPMLQFGITSLHPNMAFEGSAGLLLWRRLSVGLKYVRFMNSIANDQYNEPQPGYHYYINHLMCDVKMRLWNSE